LSSGNITAIGNVTGNYFIGNGSQLTGITAGTNYSNANVIALLANYSNTISTTGNTYLYSYAEYTAGSQGASGTLQPDWSLGPVQNISLSGSFTLFAPINMPTGGSITLIIQQPPGGSAYMYPNSVYKFAYGLNTLSTAGNSIDVLSIFYTGSTYLCNLVKGYV
jgi:hypothetical protein